MGLAISKSVVIAEVLRRRIVGLHQITDLSSFQIVDQWVPTEEGLPKIETRRTVCAISITLSTKQLDTKNIGYLKPLPESEVTPERRIERNTLTDNRGRGSSRGRGDNNLRGRSTRGRSRGRGRGRGNSDRGDRGGEYRGRGSSRGRSSRGRGRGRGEYRGRGDYSGNRENQL